MDRMKYTFLDQPAVSLFTSSTHGSSVGTVVSETECLLTELGEWQFNPSPMLSRGPPAVRKEVPGR